MGSTPVQKLGHIYYFETIAAQAFILKSTGFYKGNHSGSKTVITWY